MTDELQGQCVWVHPELAYDPGGKRNQIGTIVASDLAEDVVLVSFEDSMPGLFSTDALLVLHIPEDITAMFAETTFPKPGPNLEALIKINTLAKSAIASQQRPTLELARSHKDIQPLCLETLKEHIARTQARGWDR